MQVSEELARLLNQQVSNEQGNAHLYEQVACWLRIRGLRHIAKMFAKQAEEERGHAKKLLGYLEEVNAEVVIPSVEAKSYGWDGCEAVAQLYIEAEVQTTLDLIRIMDVAMRENDYSSQDFLQPMLREQSEEVTTAERFKAAVMSAGGNLILLDLWSGD